MIYVAIIIAMGVVAFVLVSRKYNNPYTLTFLFGKKGSGKSTYMVKLMKRDIKRGWHVYTNMEDVVLDGVRIFDVTELMKHTPEKHSSVYIDEGGLIWDDRKFKDFNSGYTEFFKYQRKYHCKMFINSQAFDVDKKIRVLTDSMALQTNIGNIIGITRPIKRTITLTEPSADSDSRIADSLTFTPIWTWKFTIMPMYYKYFESFSAPAREPVEYREVKQC